MIVKCTNCGGSHPKWDCTKPLKESTASRMDENRKYGNATQGSVPAEKATVKGKRSGIHTYAKPAGTQALPVDTNIIVAVDPSAGKDFGAKVIGRVLEDGRIEILSVTHSKAKFSKSDYQKAYMADLRTIKRLGLSVTVAEWRKTKLEITMSMGLTLSTAHT